MSMMCNNQQHQVRLFDWPSEIKCGGGLGNGKCEMVNQNADELACVCKEGYTHDMIFTRSRGCTLPVLFAPIWFGSQLCLSLMLLPYVVMKYRRAISYARMALQCIVVSSVTYIIYCVLMIANDYKMNAYSFFCVTVLVSSISATFFVIIYSLVTPLLVIVNKLKMKRMLKIMLLSLFVSFRIFGFIPYLIAAVSYSDVSNEKFDRGWSDMVEIYGLMLSFETTFVLIFVVFYGTKMISTIEELTFLTKESNQKRVDKTKSYVKKVKTLVWRVKLLVPTISIVLIIAAALQLASGLLPYNFIFTILAIGQTPPYLYMNTKFAERISQDAEETKEGSGDGNKNQQQVVSIPKNEVGHPTATADADTAPNAIHPNAFP